MRELTACTVMASLAHREHRRHFGRVTAGGHINDNPGPVITRLALDGHTPG
jgi:hypothetical protein